MTTLSKLQLAATCPGSATLPHAIREGGTGAALGRAIHKVIETRTKCVDESRDDGWMLADNIARSHELSDDDAGRLAFIAGHLRLPLPTGAMAEVSLGYFPDGGVRRIEGGAGDYPDVGQLLSGQIDCVWAEPVSLVQFDHELGPAIEPSSTLWVVDWKTGAEDYVPPVDRNWQIRGAALMAARWTGARKVVPAICYVNAAECAETVRSGHAYEGRWEVGAVLDEAALDEIETDMHAVLARTTGDADESGSIGKGSERGDCNVASGARAWSDRSVGAGTALVLGSDAERIQLRPAGGSGDPSFVLGPHCANCPARAACHAFAAEAVALARGTWPGPADDTTPLGVLTPQWAAHLAGILPAMQRTIDAAQDAVRATALANGGKLTLSDGREYAPHLEPVTSYKTAETFAALAEVVGDEKANEAFEATAASLKRALDGQPRGAWSRLRKTLETRGAMVANAREVWRTKWPAKPAEVDDAIQRLGESERGRTAGSCDLYGGERPGGSAAPKQVHESTREGHQEQDDWK